MCGELGAKEGKVVTTVDHYQRGHFLYGARRYKEACGEFLACLQNNPKDTNALAMLALAQCAGSEFDHASRSAANAVAADPSSPFAYYAKAFIDFRQDNYKRA